MTHVSSSPPSAQRPAPAFDRPVILKQSPLWAQLITLTIVAVTGTFIAWAYFAKIEEAIPAQGKLEPQGAVQPIQAPVGGVVAQIHVEEGETVAAGQLLITFDQTAAQADLESKTAIRATLVAENDFYRAQMQGIAIAAPVGEFRFATLAQSRNAYVSENRLFRAQLNGGGSLSAAQQARLRARQSEFNSRVASNRLEVQKLQRERSQINVQLVDARKRLAIETNIINRIEPLVRQGGLAEVQLLEQQQRVNESEANVNLLIEEQQRLEVAITQAQAQTENTVFTTQDQLYTSIAENEKRVADIDSQLTKAILENEKQIETLESEIKQLEQTLSYQELRAPKGGKIFDLQAVGRGFVANSSEPIMQIVPTDTLTAEVFVTNKDIGFVKPKMQVDVRVDAYPYSEFDDIDGTITQIGSDALPPDEVYNFYRFPVTVELAEQALSVEGEAFPIQSGMSVTANIKTRKRRVINIFTDLFVRKIDALKSGG